MSRVLIVEDEAHLAKGLQFNLEAEGHSVEVARDGGQVAVEDDSWRCHGRQRTM